MTHRQYPPATLNRSAVLANISPIFEYWATEPGTVADLIDEYPNAITTPGVTGANGGQISYDLLENIKILISLLYKPSVAGAGNVTIRTKTSPGVYPYYEKWFGTSERKQIMIQTWARFIQFMFWGIGETYPIIKINVNRI